MVQLADIAGTQQKAAQAGQALGEQVAGSYSIPETLRKAVNDAYNNSQDIIKPLDEKTQAYFSTPATLREKYLTPGSESYISNPFTAEKVISQGVGNAAIPMLSLSSILGQRFGRMSDLVGTGVSAYQAQTARMQSAYENLKQSAQDLLQQYQLEQAANAKTSENVTLGGRVYRLTYDKDGNVISKVDLGPSASSGSGSPFGDLKAWEDFFNKNNGTQATTPSLDNAVEDDSAQKKQVTLDNGNTINVDFGSVAGILPPEYAANYGVIPQTQPQDSRTETQKIIDTYNVNKQFPTNKRNGIVNIQPAYQVTPLGY